jgi:hypothetical protein
MTRWRIVTCASRLLVLIVVARIRESERATAPVRWASLEHRFGAIDNFVGFPPLVADRQDVLLEVWPSRQVIPVHIG